ncbi:MAG: hypothetical protein ACLR06_08920 [Christensenellaceae bacterium]
MTYEELSKKSNIPLGTIKRIMSGITPDPRESTVYAIKEALELIPKEKVSPPCYLKTSKNYSIPIEN